MMSTCPHTSIVKCYNCVSSGVFSNNKHILRVVYRARLPWHVQKPLGDFHMDQLDDPNPHACCLCLYLNLFQSPQICINLRHDYFSRAKKPPEIHLKIKKYHSGFQINWPLESSEYNSRVEKRYLLLQYLYHIKRCIIPLILYKDKTQRDRNEFHPRMNTSRTCKVMHNKAQSTGSNSVRMFQFPNFLLPIARACSNSILRC